MVAKINRDVTRESNCVLRGRPVMISLRQGGKIIDLWEKQRHQHHTVTIEQVYIAAVRNTVERIKEQKKKAREARRKERGG